VLEMIKDILKPDRDFEFWSSDEEFYQDAAITPRSNCILNCNKIQSVGVKIRMLPNALKASLEEWKENPKA
jgi:hypothetical protein